MQIEDALNKIASYIEKSNQIQSDNKTLNFEKVHSENIQNHKNKI